MTGLLGQDLLRSRDRFLLELVRGADRKIQRQKLVAADPLVG